MLTIANAMNKMTDIGGTVYFYDPYLTGRESNMAAPPQLDKAPENKEEDTIVKEREAGTEEQEENSKMII